MSVFSTDRADTLLHPDTPDFCDGTRTISSCSDSLPVPMALLWLSRETALFSEPLLSDGER